MKKKVLISLFIITSLSLSLIAVLAATDFGEFSYWYSVSSQIGFLPSTVKYYFAKTSSCTMPDSYIQNTSIYSINSWQSVYGRTYASGDESNYNVRFIAITRAEANSMGIPSSSPAFAVFNSTTYKGTGVYASNTKSVYEMNKVSVYYVWDISVSNYNTSLFAEAKWNSIGAHEYGHAGGYYDHNTIATSSNKSLMYPYYNIFYDQWGVSNPTTSDVNHMKNVY